MSLPYVEVTYKQVDCPAIKKFLSDIFNINVHVNWQVGDNRFLKFNVDGSYPLSDASFNILSTNVLKSPYADKPYLLIEEEYIPSLFNRLYNEGRLESGTYFVLVNR